MTQNADRASPIPQQEKLRSECIDIALHHGETHAKLKAVFFSKGRGHRGQVQVVLVKDGSHRSPQKKPNIFPRLQPQYVYP